MKKDFNINLEALRGFAALFVILSHIEALHKAFNPQYLPTLTVVLAPSGHLCVLVFFVLSGYVITASNQQLGNAFAIRQYAKKRFLRIYPIYFLAVGFTLLVATTHYSAYAIICNFVLLQVLLVPPLIENGPVWSLHYEVLYYLLFIPIAFFRWDKRLIFCLAILLGLADFYFYPNIYTPVISSYLFGFTFWIGGACLAKYLQHKTEYASGQTLLSTLFLLLATNVLVADSGLINLPDNLAYLLFHHHLLYPPVESSQIVISYKDLAFVPYCLYFVLVFSGRHFKYEKLFFTLLQLPLICAVLRAGSAYFLSADHTHKLSFLIPVAYFVISLMLRMFSFEWLSGVAKRIINGGAWLGGISYGIYIIHAPVIYMLGKVNFTGNVVLSYIIKVVLLLGIVLALGHLLERVFQPWIKKQFATGVANK